MLSIRVSPVFMNRAPVSTAVPFAVASFGIGLFSIMDAVMKGLSIALGAYNAMLWRLIVGAVLGGLLFLIRRERLPTRASMTLHMKRGTLAAFMALTFFWGIARVPLAEGIALSFIAPLITLYLAAVLLDEKISRHAIVASLLGLTGVGVILAGRIGGEVHDEDAMWGIASIFVSAVLYSYNLILQRQQAQISSPVEIVFFQNLVAGSTLMLAAPFLAVVPAVTYWPDILTSALLTMCSLGLLAWAYARAEAQVLVAVEYTAFVWAAIFGWIFFREDVTVATIIGTALIVAGCLIASRAKPSKTADHVETSAI